jgi:hypothetical protein
MSVFALSYITNISVSVISSNFCFLPSQKGKFCLWITAAQNYRNNDELISRYTAFTIADRKQLHVSVADSSHHQAVYIGKLRRIVPVRYNFTTFLDSFLIHMVKTAETCSFFWFAVMMAVYRSYCVLCKQSVAVTPSDTNCHLLHTTVVARLLPRKSESALTPRRQITRNTKHYHILDSGINHFFPTQNIAFTRH